MNRRSDKPALRPATIPEQAAWRPLSVKLQTENWPASANSDDTGPDDYILELGRVLINAQPNADLDVPSKSVIGGKADMRACHFVR